MKSLTEFSDLDFDILSFIYKNEPISVDKIKDRFPKIENIDYRLEVMSKSEYDDKLYRYIPNTSLIIQKFREEKGKYIATGIYETTEYGKKSLQDYKSNLKKHKREIWLKYAWIPIIVSFVTTVTTMYIVPKLPYLLKLLIGIFQKIF